MQKGKLRIAFDFDGVIAYNPLRIARAPITYIKRKIFGVEKLSFYYPKRPVEKFIWQILHDSSVLPSRGVEMLKTQVSKGRIEAHLVTGRYRYLDAHLYQWLDRYKLRQVFASINLNLHDEQPHLFKEKMLKRLKPSYFIEDNWDIVRYMSQKNITRVFWIYNILDRSTDYPYKYPHLKKALEEILK